MVRDDRRSLTQDKDSKQFIRALNDLDLDALRRVPKSDLHNHGALGMRYSSLARISAAVPPPPQSFGGLKGLFAWTAGDLRAVSRDPATIPQLFRATVEDAIADGVTVLEMSFDLEVGKAYGPAEEYARLAAALRDEFAGHIRLRPEIGLKKTADPEAEREYLLSLISSGAFDSIDLYGVEVSPWLLGRWKPLYRAAGEGGLKLKAHLGEMEPSPGIPTAAARLGLSAVQHGISLVRSPRALAWAQKSDIVFNVCPASNISLGAAESWENHPIRKMYDAGLCVSLATDDLLAFGLSVSEQFIELRRRGVFSSAELDQIRLMGLNG
jgi:adenosine deaminase